MASHHDVAMRFAQRGKPLKGSHVYADSIAIYSYGPHFPMAIADDTNKLMVINGDTASPTTSGHQGHVRNMINALCDYKSIILPYSAIQLALNTITNNNRNRNANELAKIFSGLRIIDEGEDINIYRCEKCNLDFENLDEQTSHRNDYGVAGHAYYRHLLAPSTFSLSLDWVEDVVTDRVEEHYGRTYPVYDHIERHAKVYFLSGFDETARAWNGGYFLSMLPHRPRDIAHAYEMLKPEPVKRAIAKGLHVRRQGDIFYVPDEKMTTRKLGRKGIRLPEFLQKPLIGWNDEILGYEPTNIEADGNQATYIMGGRRPRLLGTNHYATEAFKVNDSTYARGSLYHRPSGRPADHRIIRLGKAWGKIYRNTALGSWSAAGGYGRVD